MNHPFLICQKSEYDTLRSRASQSPWKDIAEAARDMIKTRTLNPTSRVSGRGTYIRDIAGSSALLYILEPEDQATHKKRITDILDDWPQFLTDVDAAWNAGGNRWFATVPISSAFFNAVLALDVIHDDLPEADLNRHKQTLADMADWFWAKVRGWAMATFGPRTVWAAFNGEDRLEEGMTQYREAVFQQMTRDGVGRNGPEYSHARLNGERTAKFGFMHVAEYTGLDRSFYRDVRLKWYYEWLFSAGCSPFHSYVTFGDSGHGRGFNTFYPQSNTWAVEKFSPLAAQYAAKRIQGAQPPFPSDLLAYCIAQPLPEGRIPQSRTWPDGGALFYEQNDTEDALMGALWNVSEPSHSHRDANAIYLAGYGEHLLLNSGYNGYGNDANGFPWAYIHDTAESSNILLLSGKNHLEKGADGIVENLHAKDFDYAQGLADRAFENGAHHLRSFHFIHPQDDAPGYFFSVDQVEKTHEEIHLTFHPASADVQTVQSNGEYQWNVKSRKKTDTCLTLFLATEPTGITLKDGALAGWRASFVGKYLYATYLQSPIITILFPHDAQHPKASMSRTADGAIVQHANRITDIFTPQTICRHIGKTRQFYFARQATHFRDGDIGFDAGEPATLFMRGKQGHIVSPGTTVTFYHPDISSVQIDGERFISDYSAAGRLKVTVPQGTCAIALD